MPKKILVVDDELDVLKVISFRLRKAGYEVITASDGQMALEVARENKPDLMLLDIRMPILDGPEVCLRIKNDESLKDIPVIFLTASGGDMVKKDKAGELKAQGFLTKPFEVQELLEAVRSFIG
ncbi:MAG: response regulator [Candidatus Omnitrophica bacterium]|nr:response regulator [Candidatus Omnitrophota bacterium]